jgi:hypothetical protein
LKSNSRARSVVGVVGRQRFQGRVCRLGRPLRSGLDVPVSLKAERNREARLLVFVAVMKVWIVRMPVTERLMPMPVRMRLGDDAQPTRALAFFLERRVNRQLEVKRRPFDLGPAPAATGTIAGPAGFGCGLAVEGSVTRCKGRLWNVGNRQCGCGAYLADLGR